MFRAVSTRVAGLVILIAGLWGGLVPFVAPYFHFALGPNHSWTWTSGRLYLSVLPAIAAVVGGLMLLASGPRVSGSSPGAFELWHCQTLAVARANRLDVTPCPVVGRAGIEPAT